MKQRRYIILCVLPAALALTSSGSVHAQPPPISIKGGNPVIAISTGIPGGQPVPVVNAATRMDYRRSSFPSKITVSTTCPGQHFTLRVLATNVTIGSPAPEVTLIDGMQAMDFLVGIPAGPSNPARCNLRYTASATFEQGNSLELGNDVHTVTYTVVAQ